MKGQRFIESELWLRASIFDEGEILLNADSGEGAWNAATGPGGILAAVVAKLARLRREEFHAAYVEYHERYRSGDRVSVPKRYLLVLGTS